MSSNSSCPPSSSSSSSSSSSASGQEDNGQEPIPQPKKKERRLTLARTATSGRPAAVVPDQSVASSHASSPPVPPGTTRGKHKQRKLRLKCREGPDQEERFQLTLDALQGRWRHSSANLGMLTVRGTAVQFETAGLAFTVTVQPNGEFLMAGWTASPESSTASEIIWKKGEFTCSWRFEEEADERMEQEVDVRNIIHGKRARGPVDYRALARETRQEPITHSPPPVRSDTEGSASPSHSRGGSPAAQRRAQRHQKRPRRPAQQPGSEEPEGAARGSQHSREVEKAIKLFSDWMLSTKSPRHEEKLQKRGQLTTILPVFFTGAGKVAIEKELQTAYGVRVKHTPRGTAVLVDKASRKRFRQRHAEQWEAQAVPSKTRTSAPAPPAEPRQRSPSPPAAPQPAADAAAGPVVLPGSRTMPPKRRKRLRAIQASDESEDEAAAPPAATASAPAVSSSLAAEPMIPAAVSPTPAAVAAPAEPPATGEAPLVAALSADAEPEGGAAEAVAAEAPAAWAAAWEAAAAAASAPAASVEPGPSQTTSLESAPAATAAQESMVSAPDNCQAATGSTARPRTEAVAACDVVPESGPVPAEQVHEKEEASATTAPALVSDRPPDQVEASVEQHQEQTSHSGASIEVQPPEATTRSEPHGQTEEQEGTPQVTEQSPQEGTVQNLTPPSNTQEATSKVTEQARQEDPVQSLTLPLSNIQDADPQPTQQPSQEKAGQKLAAPPRSIQEAKSRLEASPCSPDSAIVLAYLKSQNIDSETLEQTKIGAAVNKCRKHLQQQGGPRELSEAAAELVATWKKTWLAGKGKRAKARETAAPSSP